MAELGFRKFDDLVGRVDILETQDLIDHWKAKGLDLTNILHKPDVPAHVAIHHKERQNHGLERALDNELIRRCREAIEHKRPVTFEISIKNTNRTVGTMLSSEIARRYGLGGLPEDTVQIKFTGSAGQSFGAFLAHGITLTLEGDANDYLGKGLSGGKIIVFPPKLATFVAEENILIGNVVLYGAVLGEVYLRGLAGERFCVRNSGAKAVVEGVGDHGCEYMTGGRVVVIGPTGRNFAAGMSGGLAYIWNKDGEFKNRCNMGMVDLEPLAEEEDIQEVLSLLNNHLRFTQSSVARHIINHWDEIQGQFVKVFPKDYRRVLEEANRIKQEANGKTVVGQEKLAVK